jgi:hypothetical protein
MSGRGNENPRPHWSTTGAELVPHKESHPGLLAAIIQAESCVGVKCKAPAKGTGAKVGNVNVTRREALGGAPRQIHSDRMLSGCQRRAAFFEVDPGGGTTSVGFVVGFSAVPIS